MKVARLWGIVPHIQSSTCSQNGQNAEIASVYKGLARVGPSWAAVPPDSTLRRQLSAIVGKGFPAQDRSTFNAGRHRQLPAQLSARLTCSTWNSNARGSDAPRARWSRHLRSEHLGQERSGRHSRLTGWRNRTPPHSWNRQPSEGWCVSPQSQLVGKLALIQARPTGPPGSRATRSPPHSATKSSSARSVGRCQRDGSAASTNALNDPISLGSSGATSLTTLQDGSIAGGGGRMSARGGGGTTGLLAFATASVGFSSFGL